MRIRCQLTRVNRVPPQGFEYRASRGHRLRTRSHPPPCYFHKAKNHREAPISSAGERKMSDEEHQFESKADAGASKTYPQQAGTIRKNGYIVIKARPCKVLLYSFFFSNNTFLRFQKSSGLYVFLQILDGFLDFE